AINPIVYDQNSIYGLRIKHVLEEILAHPDGTNPAALRRITEYTKLYWGNRGNHHAFTSRKFLPEFTPAELKAAAERALENGAKFGPEMKLEIELHDLQKPIFDPNFQPMLTVKNPPHGEDPLMASGENLYSDLRLSDLGGFIEKFPLNSRLVKKSL